MATDMKHINIPIPAQSKYVAEIAAKFCGLPTRDWIGEAIYLASLEKLTGMGLSLEALKEQYTEATGLKFDEDLFKTIEISKEVKVVEEKAVSTKPLEEEMADSEVV